MNKYGLVSVIIVNYNGEKLIKKCLDALFKISYPKNKLEVIVVDNASNDGSVELIKSKYRKVKVIQTQANNYCRSCNIGITQAKGSYIVLLNNDVVVKKQWLSGLVSAMEYDRLIGAVTCKLLREDGTIQNVGHYELPNFYWEEKGAGKKGNQYNTTSEIDSISGACVLYRKKALEEIGFLDEDFVMFGEDVDMCIRLKQKRWKLVYVPSSVAFHKFHGSCNERFSRDLIERNRLLLIAKHYPHKLAVALIGNGYFVTSKDNSKSGQLFDLMPKILLKLAEYCDPKVTHEVATDLFSELKRVANYENKKLEDEMRGILNDLIETKKSRDLYKDNECRLSSEINIFTARLKESLNAGLAKDSTISKIEQQLNDYQEEINLLSARLKESLDAGLTKDSAISDIEQLLNSCKEEIGSLSSRLNESLDAGLIKDSTISKIEHQLNIYKEEINTLSARLKESLDLGLAKDSTISKIEQQLNDYQEQIDALSVRFKESLNAGLIKDSTISKIEHQLNIYQEEINTLSARLKESLDLGLAKDNTISEIERQLNNYKEEINILSARLKESLDLGLKLESELSRIYNSEGFRFVLNPLWKTIVYLRLTIKFIGKAVGDFIWTVMTIFMLPFILLQIIFFLFERIAEILFGWISTYFRKERDTIPFDQLTVSVVIPNWNGIDLLKKCLASIYEIDAFKDGNSEVLVVDDASSYSIAESIKDEFPKARVIRNRYNLGFGRTCNRGVREARGELIILLNNDIMVSSDFLEPLKAHFRDDKIFAVAPKLYYWDKKTFNSGMNMGEFKDGYLSLWNESETGNNGNVSQTSSTVFAIGGAMMFRKRDFLWLGGFDDIYRPNCWEDIDISYRAQKRGLKVLYEPKSIVYHKGAATLNYVRHKEIKNELLFMWKNLTDMRMLWEHFNQLPKFFCRGRHSTRITFLIGYFWAFDYLIPVLMNRFRERKYLRVPDKKILNSSMLYYANFLRNNYIHPDKKTVLLITPFIIFPLNSGGKLRMHNLYKRLSKKYNLILLSLIHREDEAGYAPYLKEVFNAVYTVHTKTPSNEFLFPRRYKYSFSSFLIEKLREIQEKYPVDLVHIESGELLYLTKYIKYAPIVYTEHDISILSYRKSYYRKDKHDLLPEFIDYLKSVRYHRSVYGRIDKVVALSKEDIKVLRAFSPRSDYALIPTGVDLGHFVFKEKSGKNKSLIFVGHYRHYPNEEAAVYFCRNIFPIIKKEIPEATLKLVGSNPPEGVIKLSQIDGVEVIGNVADVNPYLQEASIFVCPFKSSAGIKGKVLEAMATGTPVVCTRRGAYGINAINGSSILIADKPKVFAKSVVGLLRNDDLYQRLARNARLLVEENYDWDRIVKQLDRVYRDVMKDDQPVLQDAIEEVPKQMISPDKAGVNVSVQNIIKKTDEIVGASLDCLSRDSDTQANLDPQELHIELTHLCNSKCITCDIWDYHQRNNKSVNDELTLDEIRDFINNSKRLKGLRTVVLSGGEPFLRPDFVDICAFIKEILPQASLGILTNGMDTETIVSKTKDILKRAKSDSLWIGSSLDGLGYTYDKVRGTPGGFNRFLKTVERFKKELPNIGFSTTLCLTPFNIDQLIPCWELADKYALGFSAQFGVPKPARSPEVFQWQEKDFIRINEYIGQIIEKIITKNTDLESFHKSLTKASNKINLLTQIYYWAHLVDFQRTGKRPSCKCHAGFKFAMFDAYGNMFFCPLLKDKTIGNIREKDFDQLWSSAQAAKVRGFIDSGECSCWLLCTIFPMVGEALSLYGDKVAASLLAEPDSNKTGIKLRSDIRQVLPTHMGRVDNFVDRKDLLGSVTVNIMPNVELNNAEFKDKKYILESTPQGITLGTNYNCNANCIFCLSGEYKPFSLDLYKNYFEPRLGFMLNRSEYVSLCGMGELLMIPEIEETLDYLNDKLPDKNKILTTNGLVLNNKILERITKSKYSLQISLHSSSPLLHEYLTGIKGGFEQIIKQIRSFVVKRKDKQGPYITLVFLMNTMNIEDLPNFVELAASLGVDCVQCNYLTIFKQAHLKLSCFFKQEVTNQMLDIATHKANELKIPLILPPRFSAKECFKSICSQPWRNIYVDTEGAILPCCYSGEHFGELEKGDSLLIWNNDKFKQIRMDLASGANPTTMCKYCLNNRPDNVNLLNAHISFRPEVQKAIFEQN